MGEYKNACNNFIDAVQILYDSSIKKAAYDKTIQAQVLSCQDATIGKYRCRYQDAVIYAYASTPDVTFTNNAYVYILVPNGDMSKEKTILGTTKKLGINYISQAVGDQAYNIVGNNTITSNDVFYLDTNNINYKRIIYQDGSVNDIALDTEALVKYIKQSSSLIVGAIFKTNIPPARQTRGHYGITYNLKFLDNTSNQQVIRSYTVDEDDMTDNPYRLIYETRQYKIFDIDGPNFIGIESIQIFNSDFPNAKGTETSAPLVEGDVEITKLEIVGAVRMTESEINGIAITFYTPQGLYFMVNAPAGSVKTITAQVRIKGKLVSAAQNIPFYWGMENVNITSKSEYYNKYLGKGWKCLNKGNVISQGTQTTNPTIEWVPSGDTFILKLSDATARNNRFKVAIVYDNSVITKEINIQNLGALIPDITIQSNAGTQFYYDIGHPTLTCKINGNEYTEGYTYYWAYQDNSGGIESLPQTTELNTQYQEILEELNDLKHDIEIGAKFINSQKEHLKTLEERINYFDFIQRVDKNKIYDVQINNITKLGIFKCSVYNQSNGNYLGTASITLTNTLEGEGFYSLIINNGAATYQYNENGIAPNNKSLDVQQQIQGLSFTIYDNLGNEIDNNIILNDKENCKIRWYFPVKQTMLIDQNTESSGTDPTLTYIYYDNRVNLVYGIAQKYDIKKQRNQIKLIVDYKGMHLVTETSFTFTKQGQPGTNGTQYLVKLVPRTNMNNPPLWPMITKAGSKYFLNYGLGSEQEEQEIGISSSYQFLKAQLWRSGGDEPIWQGQSISDIAKDRITNPTAVTWEILANKYSSSSSDASNFTVTNTNNGAIRYNGDTLASSITTPYANIVKCSITWQNKTYYGTLPIITAWTYSENYRINLKDYTGWRYAIYTSDGVLPQYDSSYPFEFIMLQKINNVWEDISLVTGSQATTFDVPIAIGTPTPIQNKKLIEILGITSSGIEDTNSVYRKDCAKNQWHARPISKYDGICVNAAITQTCRNRSGTIIGRISIPIHFLLNKYGMSNINEWDGNSVQLDDEGGFILAPQVGAGSKNNLNQFTGVLMGQARAAGKTTSQIGLLGYASGDRTFFLNSKNGSAIFGKNNGGQISIDPSQNKAMIYSNNFWKNYYTDGDNDGLPSSYSYRTTAYKPSGNCNGQGMLIDLSAPEIFFGSGNFYVTSNGHVHAGGGGDIGGWLIGDTTLKSSNQTITLDSSGKVYSNTHSSLTNTGNGFYLSSDGLSIGSKVKIDNTGTMKLGRGAVTDSSTKYWTISGNTSNDSYISYGGITAFAKANSDTSTNNSIYLGTDGFTLGKRFSVSNKGQLTAYSGEIGGWSISKSAISIGGNSTTGITLNSNGSIQSKNFQSGVSGWKISNNGDTEFNNLIARKNGEIAGWKIGDELYNQKSDGAGLKLGLNANLNDLTKHFYLQSKFGHNLFYVRSNNGRGELYSDDVTCDTFQSTKFGVEVAISKYFNYAQNVAQSIRVSANDLYYSCMKYNQFKIFSNDKIAYLNVSGVYPPSDKRLKTNIKDIDSSLAKLIHPVSFNFINENEIKYGFIAQEVQKLIPGAVLESSNGYLSLNYSQLIAPLYALVQQQQKTIENLELRLSKLQKRG